MLNRKKVNKTQNERDFSSISSEERQKFLDFLRYQALLEKLKENKKVSTLDLIKQLESEVLIPVSIFCKELGTIEAICKYLKENKNLPNRKISLLIGRDSKSVWQAYDSSKKKLPEIFEAAPTEYFLPSSILQDKRLSALENVVTYLKEIFDLNYREIGDLIKRDERTVWTVYKKAMEKYAKR